MHACGTNSSQSRRQSRRKIAVGTLVIIIIAACSLRAFAADTITGLARNLTRNQPAAGDEVVLIRLADTMREEGRTKTDARGSFVLRVVYPSVPHLVRVLHQGVNYDKEASAGDAVSIDVFDASAKVEGLTSSIEIIRMGTNGDRLHVSDMLEIKNDSLPPVTQAGARAFEVYLPPRATLASVLAAGSVAGSQRVGAMIVARMIVARPVSGEPGHYSVDFPLRPGSTKFAFNYDLPYRGQAMFHVRNIYPLRQLMVMTPPAMKFKSLASSDFHVLPAGNERYQVEETTSLREGVGASFEISGIGALPAPRKPTRSSSKPILSADSATPLPIMRDPAAALHAPPVNVMASIASLNSPPAANLDWWFWSAAAALSLACLSRILLRR